jgi:predicted permease
MLGWNNRRKQLLQEFETHIESETRDNLDRGMSPAEARQAAHRTFGNVPLAVEQSREALGGLWFERLMQDIRYALRSLRGVPAYSATLVLTLALGLGCATTMLAIVESVLMRPVPLPHSDQLVDLSMQEDTFGTHADAHAISYTVLDQLNRDNHSFLSVSGYNSMVRPTTAPDGTRISVISEVTPNLFETLGIQPKLGRLIAPSDAKTPVVVVSEEFWRDRLHSNPSVIGSSIQVSRSPYTVIGVLPEAVHFPQGFSGPIVYLPVALDTTGPDPVDTFKLDSASVLARLKPGVSRQQAQADIQSLITHIQAAHPDPNHPGAAQHLVLRSYRDVVVGDLQKPLIALLGGVAVLLLIACANAANLQIGRASSRMSEMNVRAALGASFGRLLQQLVTESILVSLFSAILGGAISYAAIRLIKHAYSEQFPRFDELAIHPAVLVGTALLAVLVGVAASIAPALNIRRNTTNRVNAKNVTRKSRLPAILVSLQVALTCILLVTSGLFVRTLQQLENVSLGFDPHGVSTLVLIPENPDQTIPQTRGTETRLLHRFESLPGIQAVTMQTDIPFSNYNVDMDGTTDVAGRAFQKGDDAHYSFVSTGFVQTSGIRLLQGRAFEPSDESSPVIGVLVNQAFQKRFLDSQQPARNPIGTTLNFHRNPTDTDADMPLHQGMTILGVVENEIQGADLGAAPKPMVYIDYLQLPADSMLAGVFNMAAQYAIRSKLPATVVASELRTALKEDASNMTEMSLSPMTDAISESLSQRRLTLRLVSGFGFVALALSAIGIYGVLAYSVALRRREIGIRMALGSSRPKVARLVLTQAATMVLLGLIPGIAGAWAAGHAISSFLYGVSPLDPQTLLAVAAILLVVSAAAATQPTLRAAQVDPVETLRAE